MHLKKRNLLLLLLVLLLAGASLVGSLSAKYITSRELDVTVTFTASLAQSVTLNESRATRQSNGTYALDPSDPVSGNDYILMPGVDLPKDPGITVTGKTPIPAYLFLEVVDNIPLDAGVHYLIRDHWTRMTGVTGKHGGTVYVYNNGQILTETFPAEPVMILKNDTIYVSQSCSLASAAPLTFHGALVEVSGSRTPAEVYAAIS